MQKQQELCLFIGGNPQINAEMNSKAFINCHDFKSFEEVIAFVESVDTNDEMLLKIINEPLFKDDIYVINDQYILSFFENIFSNRIKYRNGHFQTRLETKYKTLYFIDRLKKLFCKRNKPS